MIIQNVDGLYQAAGVDNGKVIEPHGNNTCATYPSCYKRYKMEPLKAASQASGTLPACDDCGDIIKTATICVGLAMPSV